MYGWIGGEPRVARSSVWERSIDQRVPDQSTTQTRTRRFAKCKVDMDKVTSQPNAKAYCLVGSGALDIRCKWENKCTRQATHLIERDLRARDDGDGDDPVVVGAAGGAALSNLKGWGMLSIMCARIDTEPNYIHAHAIPLVVCRFLPSRLD